MRATHAYGHPAAVADLAAIEMDLRRRRQRSGLTLAVRVVVRVRVRVRADWFPRRRRRGHRVRAHEAHEVDVGAVEVEAPLLAERKQPERTRRDARLLEHLAPRALRQQLAAI